MCMYSCEYINEFNNLNSDDSVALFFLRSTNSYNAVLSGVQSGDIFSNSERYENIHFNYRKCGCEFFHPVLHAAVV